MSQRLSCETCSLNLSTLHHSNAVLFLCRRLGRLQKKSEQKKDFQEFYFLQLPANLSDILGGGRFVLDTVAPEMTSRELLPIIVVVIFILFSSCPHLIIITNLRMTEQPTLMEAPTPSHIAEEWYLGVGNVLILDHQLVDN